MAVARTMRRLLPALDSGDRNLVRDMWDRLSPLPGGTRLFTRLIGLAAPYTQTMGAHVLEVRPGYAKVVLPDRPRVRNHLRCIHAVALVNLAELTGNVGVAYSLPDDQRFIVGGLRIDYLKKARGTITGEAEFALQPQTRYEIEVPVTMRDARGELVSKAVLRTVIGPKPTTS